MTSKFAIILTIIVLVFGGCSNMDTSENYDKLFANYLNLWNTGDFANIETVISENFELIYLHSSEPIKGISGFKEHITQTREAYPDFKLTIEEHFHVNDAVAVRWSINATKTNDNDDKLIRSKGISILHIDKGIIIDESIAYDRLNWMRQLGYSLSK